MGVGSFLLIDWSNWSWASSKSSGGFLWVCWWSGLSVLILHQTVDTFQSSGGFLWMCWWRKVAPIKQSIITDVLYGHQKQGSARQGATRTWTTYGTNPQKNVTLWNHSFPCRLLEVDFTENTCCGKILEWAFPSGYYPIKNKDRSSLRTARRSA